MESKIIKMNKIQRYCLSQGLSTTEAFEFAAKCDKLNLVDSIKITLKEEACCENCLYSSKCDAPIITDNRVNASNCGSFINVKDVIIKADALSKLSSVTWYSCNDKGVLCEGAANDKEAYYKYSDIMRILGVESSEAVKVDEEA